MDGGMGADAHTDTRVRAARRGGLWWGERDPPRILEEGYKYYFGEPWKAR